MEKDRMIYTNNSIIFKRQYEQLTYVKMPIIYCYYSFIVICKYAGRIFINNLFIFSFEVVFIKSCQLKNIVKFHKTYF